MKKRNLYEIYKFNEMELKRFDEKYNYIESVGPIWRYEHFSLLWGGDCWDIQIITDDEIYDLIPLYPTSYNHFIKLIEKLNKKLNKKYGDKN